MNGFGVLFGSFSVHFGKKNPVKNDAETGTNKKKRKNVNKSLEGVASRGGLDPRGGVGEG